MIEVMPLPAFVHLLNMPNIIIFCYGTETGTENCEIVLVLVLTTEMLVL